MPQMTSLRSTGASTVYLIKSVSHFTEAGAASCLYSRFAVKQNLSRHSWYLASQVKLNPTWLSLCALWKGNTHSHVCGHRAESLPRRWFLPKTKVVPTFSKGVKEEFKNLQHLRLWKPVYDLTSSCQSKPAVWLTETQGNPVRATCCWGKQWDLVSNRSESEWAPRVSPVLQRLTLSNCGPKPEAVSPGFVHHTQTGSPWWRLLRASFSFPPLQTPAVQNRNPETPKCLSHASARWTVSALRTLSSGRLPEEIS